MPAAASAVPSFNLVIERLLISGESNHAPPGGIPNMFQSRYRAASHFRRDNNEPHPTLDCPVSISLSSGFSFQANPKGFRAVQDIYRFNLVIERLLISGLWWTRIGRSLLNVSISLSSGFSFQEKSAVLIEFRITEFQSRYRAASHFR